MLQDLLDRKDAVIAERIEIEKKILHVQKTTDEMLKKLNTLLDVNTGILSEISHQIKKKEAETK